MKAASIDTWESLVRASTLLTVQAVTILVDPVGAEKLALSLHEGKLHLVLRNPQDSDTLRVGALDTGEMLGSPPTRVAAAPVRSQRSRQAPPREYVPPPQVVTKSRGKPVVRIIRDSKVTEVPAIQDSVQ